jgi:hypothetical protein
MSVLIKCPTCGAQVTVIRDGYVIAHPAGTVPCTFVRTANSPGASTPKVQPREAADAAATRAARVAAKEAELSKKVSDRLERKEIAARRKAITVAASIRHECRCGYRSSEIPDEKGRVRAHLRSDSNRWCSGGRTPTDAERKKAKKLQRGSVWTVSGGLPTLGRRSH